MDAIEPEDMRPRTPISFKTRDGVTLHGFMTMPAHAAGARVPLVLLPHGGPHGPYDSWFFDGDAQFLASRGYAVLQVNFRGSGGRGVNFEHAGYRQWGAKIMDDLSDGLKWAIAQPDIDGKRVCAYGASFGGYAALIKAPGLLIHGGKDKRAPVEHAEDMRDALIKVNHAPEWLLAPNEGHGFYDTANVTKFYETLAAFLDKNIGK